MRSTKSSDDEDIDDFSGFLDEARAARAKQFRDTIRSCKTDDDKYNLCLDKRDRLIEEQDMLEIEFSCYDKIFSCSNKYRASKTERETIQIASDAGDAAVQPGHSHHRPAP
jgi:hypothetical protein